MSSVPSFKVMGYIGKNVTTQQSRGRALLLRDIDAGTEQPK
jgi:hypothetical protein